MSIVDTDTFELPNDLAARARLKNGVQELIDSFVRVSAEKDLQKEIIAAISEDTGVKKTHIRKLANMKFKDNKDKVAAQTDSLTSAFEILYEHPQAGTSVSASVATETDQAAIDAADFGDAAQ
ncbi:hypothetical protein [Ralstonia phage RSP15]|uniref:hypothetical protein n=1 Tax=Ralstonia phage RSP15 TaxID=1785960 RepID=UPI00074D46B1|nr:hypothetical protein BH754_gp172 [Ralstonia phage RSP15]BAU40134.1 hypothetical protein [Ralstonia phage RSP15]